MQMSSKLKKDYIIKGIILIIVSIIPLMYSVHNSEPLLLKVVPTGHTWIALGLFILLITLIFNGFRLLLRGIGVRGSVIKRTIGEMLLILVIIPLLVQINPIINKSSLVFKNGIDSIYCDFSSVKVEYQKYQSNSKLKFKFTLKNMSNNDVNTRIKGILYHGETIAREFEIMNGDNNPDFLIRPYEQYSITHNIDINNKSTDEYIWESIDDDFEIVLYNNDKEVAFIRKGTRTLTN